MKNQCSNIEYKLSDNFGFIAGRASLALSKRLQQKFRKLGYDITAEQWSILVKLWEKDGESQQEICTGTNRDKPSVTRLIDNLEKSNLVIRVPDKDDRRVNVVYLTNLGKELKNILIEEAQATYEEAFEGISEDDILTTRKVLNKLFINLFGIECEKHICACSEYVESGSCDCKQAS
jgi:DNA-binding MarR family transcriptional regulator